MRALFLCAVLLPLCQVLFAQDELPKFGKIEKEELVKKNCDYDPDAEAEVLIDYGSMQYQVSAQMVSTEIEYRVRLKILKEKGLEQANISLPYYNQTRAENISKLEAVTYNLDASGQVIVTKLDKANIFDKKIDKRWNEIVFSMPEAKVGSVIEYKYKKNLAWSECEQLVFSAADSGSVELLCGRSSHDPEICREIDCLSGNRRAAERNGK